jgi:hypothetical protein
MNAGFPIRSYAELEASYRNRAADARHRAEVGPAWARAEESRLASQLDLLADQMQFLANGVWPWAAEET